MSVHATHVLMVDDDPMTRYFGPWTDSTYQVEGTFGQSPKVLSDTGSGFRSALAMGSGFPVQGVQQSTYQILRSQHCTDRSRVRWNYGIVSQDLQYFFEVVY